MPSGFHSGARPRDFFGNNPTRPGNNFENLKLKSQGSILDTDISTDIDLNTDTPTDTDTDADTGMNTGNLNRHHTKKYWKH
jgi:hypothetical protein